MKKLSKLVLREYISPADLVNKRVQKYILGGSGSGICACRGSDNVAKCCSDEADCNSKCGNDSSYCCSQTGQGCQLINDAGC